MLKKTLILVSLIVLTLLSAILSSFYTMKLRMHNKHMKDVVKTENKNNNDTVKTTTKMESKQTINSESVQSEAFSSKENKDETNKIHEEVNKNNANGGLAKGKMPKDVLVSIEILRQEPKKKSKPSIKIDKKTVKPLVKHTKQNKIIKKTETNVEPKISEPKVIYQVDTAEIEYEDTKILEPIQKEPQHVIFEVNTAERKQYIEQKPIEVKKDETRNIQNKKEDDKSKSENDLKVITDGEDDINEEVYNTIVVE